MKRISTLLGAAIAAFLLVSTASAQDKTSAGAKSEKKPSKAHAKMEHTAWNEGDIKWVDAPALLPAGAKMAVMQGDPSKTGMFTIRLKTPDGYRVAPHWHPTEEHVTVIAGEFHVGVGDAFDDTKADTLKPGAFASMPARMHHYAWTKGETTVQVSGMGPFKLTYVNASDDPSKKAADKGAPKKKA